MDSRITGLEALLPTLATKSDLAELRTDFERLRADMSDFKSDVHNSIGMLRTDIERGQKENRTWMLGTLITMILCIIGIGNFLVHSFAQMIGK